MFTGITETTGKIVNITRQNACQTFCIQANQTFPSLTAGESVAVNGVCLTIERFTDQHFYVTAVPETLRLTNLSYLKEGASVNLERAMRFDSRIGGHCVQGHVDTVGKILSIAPDGAALLIKIALPEQFSRYLIKKGFIALDGMSITIVDCSQNWFTVTLIPHTIANSVAKTYQVDTLLNIEVDMLAKYVEKLLASSYEK